MLQKELHPSLLLCLLLAVGCREHVDGRETLTAEADQIATTQIATTQSEDKPDSDVAEPADPPAISSNELRPTIRWQDAPFHIGEKVFLVGQVANTGKSSSGHHFLNFGRRRNDVTGFIGRDVAEQFSAPPEETFKGKNVRIRGELYRYRGKPNIRIEKSADVVVLPDDAAFSELTTKEPVVREIGDVVKICTLNVLNLFDSIDNPYHKDEDTNAKLREDLDLLAKSIRHIDADVLVLQEVENRGYLNDFNRALLSDLGYQHVVLTEGNDKRGIDVAVLSRLPVGPVTSYRHLTFPDANGEAMYFRRDFLQVRIEPEKGKPFDVFAVHLKSKYGGESGDVIRLGEARMVRKLLDRFLKKDLQRRFILCGDFNDTIESPSMKAIVGTGGGALKTFFDEVPPAERITYNLEPYQSMIDFILASPAMAAEYVKGSYQIFPGSPSETGSDHNAVVARFRID